MKNARQNRIIELISTESIFTQEDLLEHLRKENYNVTQATVSRDIRELGLVKTAIGGAGYKYSVQSASDKPAHKQNRFETIFRESVLKLDFAGNIVLVKCYSGMANAACELFDTKIWTNVVGTLSGDDTFFILMRTQEDAANICEELVKFVKGKA